MELQLALCMSSPLRTDGRKGPDHLPLLPQQGGGLLLCCFQGHLISLPVLSLWGTPEKTIRNQVCMRVPSHLCPRAPRRTPSGLPLCLSPHKALRMPHPQQGHTIAPLHNGTPAIGGGFKYGSQFLSDHSKMATISRWHPSSELHSKTALTSQWCQRAEQPFQDDP